MPPKFGGVVFFFANVIVILISVIIGLVLCMFGVATGVSVLIALIPFVAANIYMHIKGTIDS